MRVRARVVLAHFDVAPRGALVVHFVRDAFALVAVVLAVVLALLAVFPAFWVRAFPVWVWEDAHASLGFLVGPLAGFPEGFLRFLFRFPEFRFRFPFYLNGKQNV